MIDERWTHINTAVANGYLSDKADYWCWGYNKEYDSCQSYEAWYDATCDVFWFYSCDNECYVVVEPKYIMELPSDPEE